MSEFDKLTLEICARSSISDDERLGLAELQLRRASRMQALMIAGDEYDHVTRRSRNPAVAGLSLLRDQSLATLRQRNNAKGRPGDAANDAAHAAAASVSRPQVVSDVQVNEVAPSQDDMHQRTPTPAMTPTAAGEIAHPAK